jgi:acetyl-CoA acetyltransferase
LLAIGAGIINTAIIVHGESGRSRVGGSAFTRISGDSSLQFHMPFGAVRPACNFGLAASRHMAVYGTTREQMAKQCVAQRQWALLHPKALMRDKGSITVEDVLNSRPVCWPFTLLMCCLVTDAAAAVVVTSVERAKNLPRKPIYILGTGEASEHSEISQMADLTTSQAAGVSGKRAFEMAGLTPKDINVAELYDAFVFTPMLALEDLGFCKPGESGPFVADGRTAPGGSFPMNTNGGGLNFTHSGMYGIHTIIECVRQLRGEAGERQVPNATYGICHGPGGMFASAGTAILGNQVS